MYFSWSCWPSFLVGSWMAHTFACLFWVSMRNLKKILLLFVFVCLTFYNSGMKRQVFCYLSYLQLCLLYLEMFSLVYTYINYMWYGIYCDIYTLYFGDIHSSISLSYLSYTPTTLHLFNILLSCHFFVDLMSLIRVACLNTGKRLLTVLWTTYWWLHYWRKWFLLTW